MYIKDLFLHNPRFNNAALYVLVNSNNELVSFSRTNPSKSDVYSGLDVIHFDFTDITRTDFYERFLKRFEGSPYGKALVETCNKLPLYASVLFIKFQETVGCYVVTEKYFNDGSHKTVAKPVSTNPDNLTDSFYSDEDCDTFVKVCPTIEDVDTYLHSKFYLDLVEQRKRNRDAKSIGYKKNRK